MEIEYRKGNLFNAPVGSMLIQCCNAQGSWSSGVAATFRLHFQYAHLQYQKHCREHLPADFRQRSDLPGTSMTTWDNKNKKRDAPYLICNLFTSNKYAAQVDSPDKIAKATDAALAHLALDPNLKKITEIHSPKMNAGLFRVPWELTENIIKLHLETLGKKWVVWEYET